MRLKRASSLYNHSFISHTKSSRNNCSRFHRVVRDVQTKRYSVNTTYVTSLIDAHNCFSGASSPFLRYLSSRRRAELSRPILGTAFLPVIPRGWLSQSHKFSGRVTDSTKGNGRKDVNDSRADDGNQSRVFSEKLVGVTCRYLARIRCKTRALKGKPERFC